jgi:protein AbiQ
LSSFKAKHRKMKNGLDFTKAGDHAVINLNCMFPVPESTYHWVDFSKEGGPRYRSLLRNEYRIIRSMEGKIVRNAQPVLPTRLPTGTRRSSPRAVTTSSRSRTPAKLTAR